jgi:hypothetical protein
MFMEHINEDDKNQTTHIGTTHFYLRGQGLFENVVNSELESCVTEFYETDWWMRLRRDTLCVE